MNTDPTARALTDAMHARVDHVTADPRLVSRAHARARSARRRDTALVGLAAGSAAVVVGAVAMIGPNADRLVPERPAASSARATKHPRYAPAVLPTGFRATPFSVASEQMPPQADGRPMWEERLNYGRDFDASNRPRTVIVVSTVTGEVPTITPAFYQDTEPDATWSMVGHRKVVHVRNMLDEPSGLDVYEWTEAPGINILVTGSGDLTDAEVRAFIAALRREQ